MKIAINPIIQRLHKQALIIIIIIISIFKNSWKTSIQQSPW